MGHFDLILEFIDIFKSNLGHTSIVNYYLVVYFLWRRAKLESHLGIVRPEVTFLGAKQLKWVQSFRMCLKKNRWHTSISSRTVRQQNKFADTKWLMSLKMFIFYCKQYVWVSADEYTCTETYAIVRPTYSIWLWNIPACKTDYFVSISPLRMLLSFQF